MSEMIVRYGEDGRPYSETPLVRCQDCKKGTSFKRADGNNIYICDKVRGVQHGNWYCADGERKENNE